MGSELQPVTRKIVGTPMEVRTAIRTQAAQGLLITHPRDVEMKHRADGMAETTVTLLAPADRSMRNVRVRRPRVQDEIGRALAFVAVVAVLGAGLVATAWLLLGTLSRHVDWSAIGGLAFVALIAALIVANRSNHSGACPGIVIHCNGCKGHKR